MRRYFHGPCLPLKVQANFSKGADLGDADLTDTILRNANLSGTNLSGTNLSDANLKDADLSKAMDDRLTQRVD